MHTTKIGENIKAKLRHKLWDSDLQAMKPWRAWLWRGVRILAATGQDMLSGQLSLRASSLAFTTLLSLVPLLALSFSVLKALGVHNQMEPLLLNFFAPLGEKGGELAQQLIQFVENVSVKALGAAGLLLLLYTALSLMQKIESAFNLTWRVRTLRPWSQRISGYFSVVLLGPLLMFAAVGASAAVVNSAFITSLLAVEPFGSLYYALTHLLPYVLVIGAFTVTYVLIPNTRVKWSSALVGALAAGVLWQETGRMFAYFVAGSTKYTAIYSSFAIVLLSLIWVYISWLILLLGSAVAFYHQHPACQRNRKMQLSLRSRQIIALEVMRRAVLAHFNGARWTRDTLAEELALPVDRLDEVLEALRQQGLLVMTADEPGYYLPGRSPSVISAAEVLRAVQGGDDLARQAVKDTIVWEVYRRMNAVMDKELGECVLADLFSPEFTRLPRPAMGAAVADGGR